MGRPTHHDDLYLRAFTLSGIDGFLASHGLEPTCLLEELGIKPSQFSEVDGFLSWNAVCTLFESAARNPGLARFGLLWSVSLSPDRRQIGPLVHLASLSTNGREYIDLSARYELTHKNGIKHTVHENSDQGLVIWRMTPHPYSIPCRQMIEYSISNSYRLVRQFLSMDGIKEIHFTYDEPDDRRLYDDMFDCPVIFGAEHSQLILRQAYLDKDLKAASPSLRGAVREYLDHRSRMLTTSPRSMSQAIQGALPTLFGVNRTDMHSVASIYGMSEKKLQRLLRDEGTSFSALRNEARRGLAESLLLNTNIPISRLAIFLDYAGSSAFHHACKRWFGMSPRAFRKGG